MVSEYPVLVEEVRIKEGVEGLVLKGANLMWDGVENSNDLGKFEKDSVRAILDSKGRFLILLNFQLKIGRNLTCPFPRLFGKKVKYSRISSS